MADPSISSWDRGRKQRDAKTTLRPLKRLLILCEDTKSSVLYFKKFKVNQREVEIQCIGTGKNTDSLVEDAIQRKGKAINEHRPYQHIWIVFDRDSFPLDNFNRTRDLVAPHNDITLCWSNECFEVWYLLHFDFFDTSVDRHGLGEKITAKTGIPYDKACADTFNHLKEYLPKALQNAKKLEMVNQETHGDRYRNPSTRVHLLVQELLKFAED